MGHNFRQSNPLDRRRIATRQPKPKIVVVCEGKVTEPQYFADFRLHYGNSLVTVTSIGGCGVPVSVVERAIVEKYASGHPILTSVSQEGWESVGVGLPTMRQ